MDKYINLQFLTTGKYQIKVNNTSSLSNIGTKRCNNISNNAKRTFRIVHRLDTLHVLSINLLFYDLFNKICKNTLNSHITIGDFV